MNTTASRFNPWPYAIIGWFVIFISAMATWAVVAIRQDMDLVRKDYYEAELAYQRQIDQLSRAQSIAGEVRLAFNPSSGTVDLAIPESLAIGAYGKIHLYRPSNARLDQKLPFQPDARGHQQIEASALETGLWKVRLEWTSHGREYLVERAIVVANTSEGRATRVPIQSN